MSRLDYEKERFKKFLSIPTQNQILYVLFGLGAVCLIMGFTVGRLSNGDSEPIVKIDTVFVDKPIQLGGTLSPATVIVDKDSVSTKPLPAITSFKVSDVVCVWGKWTGVVVNVHWSERNPDANVLVYEVKMYDEEEGWYEEGYYASEITIGKCN